MSDFYEDGENRVRGPFLGHNKLGLRDREDETITLPVHSEPPLRETIEQSKAASAGRETYQRKCRACDGGAVVIRRELADDVGRCPICKGRGTVTSVRRKRRNAASATGEARTGLGVSAERA